MAIKGQLSRFLGALVLLFAVPFSAQTSGIKTYANPIDINYQYNFEQLIDI